MLKLLSLSILTFITSVAGALFICAVLAVIYVFDETMHSIHKKCLFSDKTCKYAGKYKEYKCSKCDYYLKFREDE